MRRLQWLILMTACAGPSANEKTETIETKAEVRDADRPYASKCKDVQAFTSLAGYSRPKAEVARLYVQHCALEETVQLTSELIRFPTVSATESPADGKSFAAMKEFLRAWAERFGMRFEVYGNNDAWEIQLGEGEPLIGFVMHADVVPAEASEWKTPPFEPKREGNLLYGRGSEDDKGPIAAVLVMMHALQRFGVPLSGRISAIMGTGEEHNWDGMVAYAKERPHPKYVISLDAGYPVVVAESGFVAWRLSVPKKVKRKQRGCAEVSAAEIGQFLTVVPGEAKMSLSGAKRADVDRAITSAAGEGFSFEVAESGAALEVMAKGAGIHSSEADKGANALWALSRVAAALPLCEGGSATLLSLVAKRLDGDHWGEKLGLAYQDPMMGRLLVVPTMLHTEGDRTVLSVNMRRPAGKTSPEFEAELDRVVAELQKEFSKDLIEVKEQRFVGEAAVADTSGPLVKTLLAIYSEATGEKDPKGISIRGGTYARLFPGAVSFGPALPGHPYLGHVPNEYVELDALGLMTRTTLEAVLRLGATTQR